MSAILFVLIWAGLGAFTWATGLKIGAQISYYNARRRAERAAWERDRRLRRLIEHLSRPVKPSAIAISFHALTDDCAVERLLSRLHPVGARPSPESE